jgi:uncharacterized protein
MKSTVRSLALISLVLSFAAVAGTRSAGAAENAPQGKIRVLVTFGGHGFEERPFWAMWDALPGVIYSKAQMPRAADMLKPGLQKKYDVIVMYDMVQRLTQQQRNAFVALLKSGIGLVSLHHNLCAQDDWPELRNIIGGKYLLKETEIDGKKYSPSEYSDDQDMSVTVAARNHPITTGVDDFKIHDEAYRKFYVAPDSHVLLTIDHPKCGRDVAWVHSYGKSRVFYLMFGHDPAAWQNPNYPRLLLNGIHWAARK